MTTNNYPSWVDERYAENKALTKAAAEAELTMQADPIAETGNRKERRRKQALHRRNRT